MEIPSNTPYKKFQGLKVSVTGVYDTFTKISWDICIVKVLQNLSCSLLQAEFLIYYVKRPEFY